MSEQDSESDTIADDTEGSKSTEDEEESEAIEIQQVHNVLNKTTHDEKDISEDKSVTEIETYQVMGRQDRSHKTLYKIIFKKNIFKNLQTYYILKTL